MAGVEYTILLTDEQLTYVGDPIVDWETLDVVLKFNEPGSGSFTIPAYAEIEEQLVPGRRVVVIRNLGELYDNYTHVLISGPIEQWQKEQADDGENAGIGKLTVHFADDLASIAARAVYPNPAVDVVSQDADNWQMTGTASTVLYAVVNVNAGPGALAPRQMPNLKLTADSAIGSTVTVKAQRMEPIGAVMRAIAETGGGLGFRTYQADDGTSTGTDAIWFDVYSPPDKTGQVFFGFGLGNMRYRSVEVSAPTTTSAFVGGMGEGADRAMIERTNGADEAAWGRFEKLISRPGTTAAQELQDYGDQELAKGASTVRVASSVSDIPDQRFGLHYQVGDRVSVEIGDGQFISDLVVTCHVQAFNAAGEYVAPTIGSQAEKTDPIWTQRLRSIEERLGRVERSVVPATPTP